MADDQTRLLENQTSYSTRELKLASLLLGEIQGSTVQVYSDGNNSPKKIIKIIFPVQHQAKVNELILAFIDRNAIANISSYNRSINTIRDKLRAN